MADFLSRLAERTLGMGETVQPRLAPLFARGAELADEGLVEEDETRVVPPNEAPAAPQVMPAAAPNPAGEVESVPAASPEPRSRRQDDAGIERRSVVREEPAPLLPPRDVRPARRVEPPPAETSAVGDFREMQPPLLLPERRAAPARPSASPAPAAAVRPPGPSQDERTSTDGGRAQARAAEVAPTVRVTIGRVEVRAVFPAVEAPRVSPAPPGPRLTLQEYLKQRREGVR